MEMGMIFNTVVAAGGGGSMGANFGNAPLPASVMLIILLGQGLLYTGLVWYVGRSRGTTAESYLTGGRDIGHGMINASIIATWVWAATLMVSSWTAYSYGFIGGWWYGLGAVLPLPIVGALGKRLRRLMPKARSYVEFIKFRLDNKNHILLTIISIIVSAAVTVMIVTGASLMAIAFSDIPFWMVAGLFFVIFLSYTAIAGLWASVFADTIMVMIMYVAMIVIVVGATIVVGPGEIYDGLMEVIKNKPILQPGASAVLTSHQHDPLNWLNLGGLGFLVINIIGNLGAVICNQTYWARAISAKDEKTVLKSFVTAGICWFPIPLAIATTLGLYGLSKMLTVGETYYYGNFPMLFGEAESIAPLSSFLILGFVGLACFVVAVVGASISTGAGELLSCVICMVNDLYKGYFKKDATDKQILKMSRILLFVSAGFLYGLVMYLRHINFPFAGMYQAMGISFSSAVIPVCLAFLWSKLNRNAAFYGALLGAVCGVGYWWSVGFDMSWGVVWSNVIVLGVSGLITIGWTLIRPEKFDFDSLKDAGFDSDSGIGHHAA